MYSRRQQRNFWRKERERYLYLLGQSVAKSAIIKFKNYEFNNCKFLFEKPYSRIEWTAMVMIGREIAFLEEEVRKDRDDPNYKRTAFFWGDYDNSDK